MADKSVLVTGCSSGIGQVRGTRTADARLPGFRHSPHDRRIWLPCGQQGWTAVELHLDDPESVADAARQVLEASDGYVYGLFNNGAYGQPGAVEDLTWPVLEATAAHQPARLARADAPADTRHARPRRRTHHPEQLGARIGRDALPRRLQLLEIRPGRTDRHAASRTARQRHPCEPDRTRPDHEPLPRQRACEVPAEHRRRAQRAPRQLPGNAGAPGKRGTQHVVHAATGGGAGKGHSCAGEPHARSRAMRSRHPPTCSAFYAAY